MTPRRHALALAAALLLGTGDILAVFVATACSEAAATTLCDSQTLSVGGGAYMIMNNEWGSRAPQCITTDGNAGFTVANSSITNAANGSPGGYPSIYKGCHWGACTPGSGFPIQVSSIHAGTVTTSWSTTQPGGGNQYNVAYDIWFNKTPTTSGQPNGAELMIWLNHNGPMHPSGSQVAGNLSIGGRSYHVWFGNRGWNTISYMAATGTTSVSNLDLQALVADALSRGYIRSSWYLIDVEAGFELWQGGAGLATNSFSVNVAGDGEPPPSPAPATWPGSRMPARSAMPRSSPLNAYPVASASSARPSGFASAADRRERADQPRRTNVRSGAARQHGAAASGPRRAAIAVVCQRPLVAAWYCSTTLAGIRPRSLTEMPWSFAQARISPLR